MRKPVEDRERAGEERSRRKPMGAWNAAAPENIAMHPTRTLRCTMFVCSFCSQRCKGRFKCEGTFGVKKHKTATIGPRLRSTTKSIFFKQFPGPQFHPKTLFEIWLNA